MNRAWAVFAIAMLALGCRSREAPVRGAHPGVDLPPPNLESAEPARGQAETPAAPEPRELGRIVIGTTTEEIVQRDLGAELHAALGSPTMCLRDYASDRPTTIRISVSAIVRPTGMCIEPKAYGSGLSAAALKCIEQRVGTVVLKELEDTTESKTASTVVEINYEPPAIVEADPGMPEPDLKNASYPLPKRPTLPRTGIPIDDRFRGWLDGGDVKQIEGTKPRKIVGPKPRAIDGYEVDENAQDWR